MLRLNSDDVSLFLSWIRGGDEDRIFESCHRIPNTHTSLNILNFIMIIEEKNLYIYKWEKGH